MSNFSFSTLQHVFQQKEPAADLKLNHNNYEMENRMEIVLKRDQLYEQVWNTPTPKLAEQYGITLDKLKRACKKMNIPTPPQGYWIRIANGYEENKLPLPELSPDQPDQHVYLLHKIKTSGRTIDVSKHGLLSKEALDIIERIEGDTKVTQVKDKLYNPHPLVREAQQILINLEPDSVYGALRPARQNCLNIRVTKAFLNRALRFMDTLIKCFEWLGVSVETKWDYHDRYPETYIELFNEQIKFSLNERLERIEHEPDTNNKTYSSYKEYDYASTGSLFFSFDAWGADGLRKTWSDSPKRQIEVCVKDIIVGAVLIADACHKESLRRAEENRLRQIELEKKREEQRLYEREQRRLRYLEKQASMWQKSQQIHLFVKEVENKFNNGLSCDMKEQLEEWLSWARKHADDINPLINELPFLFEEDEEEEEEDTSPTRLYPNFYRFPRRF